MLYTYMGARYSHMSCKLHSEGSVFCLREGLGVPLSEPPEALKPIEQSGNFSEQVYRWVTLRNFFSNLDLYMV